MSSSPASIKHPLYRPDIDGLRALAVLAVIIFHAFPDLMSGGFIGVDIFFVISGFLISTIIFDNLDKGAFSLTDFYIRRIKRIFPSLLLVLIFVLTFGWFALLANEYKELGKHVAAAATFLSNFVLLREAGYFDNSADTKPLIHLWSLAVEEQFYIFWPVFIWVSWKSRLNLLVLIIFLIAVSFYLNLRGVRSNPISVFYLPHTRSWELFCGCLLAWIMFHQDFLKSNILIKFDEIFFLRRIKSRLINSTELRNFFPCLGLLLIASGFWGISRDSNFPGVLAIIPVLGAFLIIASGTNTWINKQVLSNRVIVKIGLISFPLYLWHWPILSFAVIVEGETPNNKIRIAALILSFFLAWITYKFIELPIRKSAKNPLQVIGLVGLVFCCLAFGLIVKNNGGLKSRGSPITQVLDGDIGHDIYFEHYSKIYFECSNKKISNTALMYSNYKRCMQSQNDPKIEIVIVGDSHAEQLFMGIAKKIPSHNVAYYIKSELPLIDSPEFSEIFLEIKKNKSVKTVILSALWSRRVGDLDAKEDFKKRLISTLQFLEKSGKRVVITNNIPMFPFSPNRCGQVRKYSTKITKCEMDKEDVDEKSKRFRNALEQALAAVPKTEFIDLQQFFCTESLCSMQENGKLLYRDNRHLNINGSEFIGGHVVRDYSEILNAKNF